MPNTLTAGRATLSLGALKAVFLTITGPTSYTNPGGAVEFSPASLGMASIQMVLFQDSPSGHIVRFDPATNKVKWYWSGTASAVLNEVTNGTNLSAVSVVCLVLGN